MKSVHVLQGGMQGAIALLALLVGLEGLSQVNEGAVMTGCLKLLAFPVVWFVLARQWQPTTAALFLVVGAVVINVMIVPAVILPAALTSTSLLEQAAVVVSFLLSTALCAWHAHWAQQIWLAKSPV